ncbi:hypothetical protein BD560DRAFT_424526 [Blakeslea trispora]|nr:hypothetical protein BD560DRAFT_424526 [Blakeslea trispora]
MEDKLLNQDQILADILNQPLPQVTLGDLTKIKINSATINLLLPVKVPLTQNPIEHIKNRIDALSKIKTVSNYMINKESKKLAKEIRTETKLKPQSIQIARKIKPYKKKLDNPHIYQLVKKQVVKQQLPQVFKSKRSYLDSEGAYVTPSSSESEN